MMAHMARLSLSQPDRLRDSCDDHVRLLKAYEERDPNLAAALIRARIIEMGGGPT